MTSYEIIYKDRKMLVTAEVQAPDYDVGICGYWSEDHTLQDPETEERRADWEADMSDEDWEEIAVLFDDMANDHYAADCESFELQEWLESERP